MTNVRIILTALFIMITFIVCSSPDEKANKLYVDSSRLMEKTLNAEKISYTKVFEYYKAARKKIELIITKYPSSNISVRIINSEIKIGEFTLKEFRDFEDTLRMKAYAEENPLACGLLVANTIKSEFFKARAQAGIAVKYAEAGQIDKALEVVNSIEFGLFKARALAEIAGIYAEEGQMDKATALLYQALELVNTIKYTENKPSVISIIAGKYAETGQMEKALEVANMIDNAEYKAHAMAIIAGKYAEAGQMDKTTAFFFQALEVANTIEYTDDRARSLAEILGKYAETGQELNEPIREILQEIIRTFE